MKDRYKMCDEIRDKIGNEMGHKDLERKVMIVRGDGYL